MRLMIVWRITGKIISTSITVTCALHIMESSYNFRFRSFLCFVFFCKLSHDCALPGSAIPEMTYTVSGGTLNPTHSLVDWDTALLRPFAIHTLLGGI